MKKTTRSIAFDDMLCTVADDRDDRDDRDEIRTACLWASMGKAYRRSGVLGQPFVQWIESKGLRFKVITSLTIARSHMVRRTDSGYRENEFNMSLRVTVEGRLDDDEHSPTYTSIFYLYSDVAVSLGSI